MGRERLVPDDDTLRRIFGEHPEWTVQQFAEAYGWPVSWRAVAAHRRRLSGRSNPIAGVAAMSHDEFWAHCAETTAARQWAVTGVDNRGVTRIHSGGEEG